MKRSSLLWVGFIGLNIAFAVAVVILISRSSAPTPTPAPATLSSQPALSPSTNLPPASISPSNAISVAPSKPSSSNSNPIPNQVSKRYDWRDIGKPTYLGYLEALRAAGAPERIIRHIVLTDANDLYNQRRLEVAVTNDFKWWGAENQLTSAGYNPEYQNRMQALVEDRSQLLNQLLGSRWEAEDKTPSLANHTVALTGPVLGALPPETYLSVQEICARSVTRHQDYQMSRFNEGLATSPIELAKLRDQTRKELSLVLDHAQLEEFLLRYSHNAVRLRDNFRGLNLTADEFRKIFRATDAIDHQIQLEYGGEDALSAKQKEQLLRQREQSISGVLGEERYERLVLSRDPHYQQAQRLVLNNGAPDAAIQPLFQLFKANALKRQEIQASDTLTPEQKRSALAEINQEQFRSQQRILQSTKANP